MNGRSNQGELRISQLEQELGRGREVHRLQMANMKAAEAAAKDKLQSIEDRLEAEYEGALAQLKNVADQLQAKSHAYTIIKKAFDEAQAAWKAGPVDPEHPCPYCGINARRYKGMTQMLNQVKVAGITTKDALKLKADLAHKQTVCAELETQAEGLNEELRQYGLRMTEAQKANDHLEEHRSILLRDAEARAATSLDQLRELQASRSSASPGQRRLEDLQTQNEDLRAYTGELTAQVEDMGTAHAEVLARNEVLETEVKNMKVDMKTYMDFSIPGTSDQE